LIVAACFLMMIFNILVSMSSPSVSLAMVLFLGTMVVLMDRPVLSPQLATPFLFSKAGASFFSTPTQAECVMQRSHLIQIDSRGSDFFNSRYTLFASSSLIILRDMA